MIVTESADRLKIEYKAPFGVRIFFFVIGLIPLIAPYELLLKPRWNGFGPGFYFFAFISVGAMSITCGAWFAAIAVRSVRYVFVARTRELQVRRVSPFLRPRYKLYSFDEIGEIRVQEIDWSEGPAVYYVDLYAAAAMGLEPAPRKLESLGSFKTRMSAEAMFDVVERGLGRGPEGPVGHD